MAFEDEECANSSVAAWTRHVRVLAMRLHSTC